MNIATMSAKITRIAPNANGGPGIMPCKHDNTMTFSAPRYITLHHY